MASAIDLTVPGVVSIRPLTAVDRDACVAVENAAFPNPAHRASADKFAYRLAVCPELCLGLFVQAAAPEAAEKLVPGERVPIKDDGSVLVAHIISTRCRGPVVTDSSMGLPADWRTATSATAADVGHQPDGGTVAIHSLAVVPSVQAQGMGTRLMRAYLERMRQLPSSSGPAGPYQKVDRVALICQDYLVEYYKKLGYTLIGPSAAQFGGGGWFDLYYDMDKTP